MLESWVIYNISTGMILCYGKNIDRIADQAKIDLGDTTCTLYMIQQFLSENPSCGAFYSDCNCIDVFQNDLKEIDHDLQEIIDMPIEDIKAECKRLANHDIVSNFGLMNNLSACVERIQGSIPDEAQIQSDIQDWMDALELSKSTIDGQIAALSTRAEALEYYGSKAWFNEFPTPVEWEDM